MLGSQRHKALNGSNFTETRQAGTLAAEPPLLYGYGDVRRELVEVCPRNRPYTTYTFTHSLVQLCISRSLFLILIIIIIIGE